MRKQNYTPSIFFLILVALLASTGVPRQAQADDLSLPRYAVHYIQKGDNLHLIAAYYLLSPRKWETVFDENRNVISNPNLLVVGEKLVIPVSKAWARGEPYEKFKERLETRFSMDDLASEILDLSKAYAKIQDVPSQIMSEITRDSLGLGGTPEEIDLLHRKVMEKIEPAAIIALILGDIKTSMEEPELKELFHWYNSPLGIKITGLDDRGLDPEKWKTVPGVSDRITKARETDVSRVEKLNDLDLSSRLTQRVIMLKRNLLFAVASASFEGGAQKKNFEELRNFVNEKKAGFFLELEDEMIFSLIFTYESLSDNELNRYLEFLKTPASQRFTELISKRLNEQIISSFRPTPQG